MASRIPRWARRSFEPAAVASLPPKRSCSRLRFGRQILGRTLRADDIAGIGDIYPSNSYTQDTGSISGKVTKSGKGVLGAHVIAFDLRTQTLVGGFSLSDDGSFVIAGLDPGPHILRVEPLDDADIESFFDLTLNIDVNFRVQFYNKVVVVPKGGGTSGVEMNVVAK